MSKLYKKYTELKSNDSKKLYLFKAGIFYIFIDEDAKLVSNKIGLKLSNLNENIVRCGFPVSHISKYSELLKKHSIDFTIVDESFNIITSKNYFDNINLYNFIEKFSKSDIEYISIADAFGFLREFKNIVDEIKGI